MTETHQPIERVIGRAIRATAKHAMRYPPTTPQRAYKLACNASVIAGLAGLQKGPPRKTDTDRDRWTAEWARMIAETLAECRRRDAAK